MIMARPRRLTTTPTLRLVRQTASPTQVPSTAVDTVAQIITATLGLVVVMFVPEVRGRDLEEHIREDPSSL